MIDTLYPLVPVVREMVLAGEIYYHQPVFSSGQAVKPTLRVREAAAEKLAGVNGLVIPSELHFDPAINESALSTELGGSKAMEQMLEAVPVQREDTLAWFGRVVSEGLRIKPREPIMPRSQGKGHDEGIGGRGSR